MRNLRHLESCLRDRSLESVTFHEDGAASFIVAENNLRAIEVSPSENLWWIEFWDLSVDEDSPPVREETVSTDQEAIAAILGWLDPHR